MVAIAQTLKEMMLIIVKLLPNNCNTFLEGSMDINLKGKFSLITFLSTFVITLSNGPKPESALLVKSQFNV